MMAGLIVSSLLLCAAFIPVVLIEAKGFQCIHERNPKIVFGVQIGKEKQPVKRQSPNFAPLRISVIYDSSVDALTVNQRNRLQNTVMPAVESFFEEALMVIPATDPILLERDCVGGTFFLPIEDVRRCVQQCEPTTTCSVITIPEDHLKRCVQCNGDSNTCETVGTDGPGVNTDFILYVGTIACANSGTLAFATDCQLESSLDRPIAGIVNFCPGRIDDQSDEELIETGIHEVLHTLVFSSDLYPFYRDENGNPRTPRDGFGRPPRDTSGFFVASDTTIRTETYTDWQTRIGVINHDVQLLVTPNVIEQAMLHYNCSTLRGVEVENQGGSGTATSHWEQRILGNEGMTGIALFNAPFSRITFGLLQDSGWYIPNYSMAEELAWGRNSGCRFVHGSCGEWIATQLLSGSTLAPFCNRLRESPVRLGCTIDRSIVSFCNLIDFGASPPPPEFQYFNSGANFDSSVAPRVGGSLFSTDFCPFQNQISIGGTVRECSVVAAQPTNNILAETYGSGSRCVEHGRQWSRTEGGITTTAGLWGGGCYQHTCSVSTGVKIQVQDLWFQCDCEGEELVLDITVSDTRFQGSLICPSCAQICFDNTSSCPSPEPAACYGRQTTAVPITEVGVGGDPHFSIVLPNNELFCYTIQGESGSIFNLISNNNFHMNALFVAKYRRKNATRIAALGVVIFNKQSSNTKLTFDGRVGLINIGNGISLAAENIQGIHFHRGELSVSRVQGPKQEVEPRVIVSLDDIGLHFNVRFTRKHLEIFWQSVGLPSDIDNSHGLIGQFFRSGVEIDEVQRIVILPGKNPVPVSNRPLWGFMRHKLRITDDEHRWTAMNHGEQGEGLIDGVYRDYLVDNILSDDFKFKQ